ncbi:MAG: TIM barrel protein, partial [Planctomycetaceae bacterium]|nr:TIM barrel protein [Planctomycetaceae bacterium]
MKCSNTIRAKFFFLLSGLVFLTSGVGIVSWSTTGEAIAQEAVASQDVFRKENLVAWCIVPFDRGRRNPEQRAAMLEKMGVKRLAYDYRAEHIPTFQEEVDALKRHGIELTAWWFPTVLNDEAKAILAILEKNQIKAQLWVTGGGANPKDAAEQQRMVEAEAARIKPIAEAAAKIGCTVGLYNHGGWFGEPENQIAIIETLKMPNVGIVYNLHHGHSQLDRLPELIAKMKPYLLAFNLNGMDTNGDQVGKKILPIGEGGRDTEWIKAIRDSGYTGPIGILNHTDEDAEARLLDNLDGLHWLLDGKKGDKPNWRSWKPAPQPAISGGLLLPDERRFRHAPLTLEMTAKIESPANFNILAASDTKASHEHWELFTHAGSGNLAVYLPGRIPDHVNGNRSVTDGKLHHYAMVYELNRVRLYVDGELIADQAIERKGNKKPDDSKPEGFALGRLVEGGLYCAGSIQWARISSGTRDITPATAKVSEKDDKAWAVWQFDEKGVLGVNSAGIGEPAKPTPALTYDPKLIETLLSEAKDRGNAKRGISVFADAKSACLSCHQIGSVGGKVGPALTEIGKQRDGLKIVESLLWPNREVEDKFQTLQVLTADGEVVRGYKVRQDAETLVIRDPAAGTDRELAMEDVEETSPAGSLMPEGLVGGMGRQQQLDLIRLLIDLGKEPSLEVAMIESALHQAHGHQPAKFPLNRAPIDIADWPHWETFINRDRLYEFYAKQAEFFRVHEPRPTLLGEFPGLDGGPFGHWGNQNEASWANDNWNNTELGSVLGGVFNSPNGPIARAVCVALGETQDYGVCFNPDTLTYEAFWKGGFLK